MILLVVEIEIVDWWRTENLPEPQLYIYPKFFKDRQHISLVFFAYSVRMNCGSASHKKIYREGETDSVSVSVSWLSRWMRANRFRVAHRVPKRESDRSRGDQWRITQPHGAERLYHRQSFLQRLNTVAKRACITGEIQSPILLYLLV